MKQMSNDVEMSDKVETTKTKLSRWTRPSEIGLVIKREAESIRGTQELTAESTTRLLAKTAVESVESKGAVGSATGALAYTTIPSEMNASLKRLAEESESLPPKIARRHTFSAIETAWAFSRNSWYRWSIVGSNVAMNHADDWRLPAAARGQHEVSGWLRIYHVLAALLTSATMRYTNCKVLEFAGDTCWKLVPMAYQYFICPVWQASELSNTVCKITNNAPLVHGMEECGAVAYVMHNPVDIHRFLPLKFLESSKKGPRNTFIPFPWQLHPPRRWFKQIDFLHQAFGQLQRRRPGRSTSYNTYQSFRE
jgi:hypothetical protein